MSLLDELLDFEGQAVSPRDKDLRIRAAERIKAQNQQIHRINFEVNAILFILNNAYGAHCCQEAYRNQFEKY